MTDKEKLEALLRKSGIDQEDFLTDEEKDDFIVTLGGKMRSRFLQAIADVLDDIIEEAVNSTLNELKRHVREKGGN